MEGPHSSYSCLEIHICWKVEREARMDPPIQTEYFLSGGAMILILMVEGARADPPLSTASASNSSIHTDHKPAPPSSLCNIYQYQGIIYPDHYQWICKNIEIYELKKK